MGHDEEETTQPIDEYRAAYRARMIDQYGSDDAEVVFAARKTRNTEIRDLLQDRFYKRQVYKAKCKQLWAATVVG